MQPEGGLQSQEKTAIVSQMKQADQANNYQINCHNKIEQARHDQN
jgi:hypothetical protein